MKKIDIDVNPNWSRDLPLHEDIVLFRGNSRIGTLLPDKLFKTITVNKVLNSNINYYIPSYQRGYRWTKNQVCDLLNDIWEWSEEDKNKNTKYCLQPIIVSKNSTEGYIDLVDGQQRLTTLLIILKAIDRPVVCKIEYETRKESSEFLKNLSSDSSIESEDNIDFYHMYQTYITVKDWFNNNGYDADKWYKKLMNNDNGGFFIDYTIVEEVDKVSPRDVFTRINAGKIPLTHSELAKAIILNKKNFESENYLNEYIEISLEWDRIENKLRDDNFWAWMHQKDTDNPHIDLILDIVSDEIMEENNIGKESKISSYITISNYIKKNNVAGLWKKIKCCFMTLEDWYDNNESYHLLGFICQQISISELYLKYINNENFSLKSEITNNKLLFEISNLTFEDVGVKKILLLFNLITCIKNKMKFRFDDYYSNDYDIEHIAPHSGFDKLDNQIDREKWIEEVKKSGLFLNSDAINSYQPGSDLSDDVFEHIYTSIIKSEDTFDVDRLGNLCLLDKTTNRGYGNKPFPNKVREITEVDAENKRYILPCTKNVFLKYYSGLNINNYTWSINDAEKYEIEIENTIKNFFNSEE